MKTAEFYASDLPGSLTELEDSSDIVPHSACYNMYMGKIVLEPQKNKNVSSIHYGTGKTLLFGCTSHSQRHYYGSNSKELNLLNIDFREVYEFMQIILKLMCYKSSA
ncbi:hypothetical protein PR048_019883 [Dryococelus australis]|uniref:Uncharacterized protein n=1 Tax=Dryococelus australis TaxID=614101 RepID=A0ABQ9H4Y1_9NEOP|nr:hypothetical protein PR048_019883 [Dryococelus australis]